MSTSGLRPSAAGSERFDGEGLVAAARALAPAIDAAAEQIERERQLPADLVERLLDAGLFTMLLPASLGGAEIGPPTFARAVEELARADGSVAWCVGQANGLAAYMAYLEPSVARELFPPGPRSGRLTTFANGPGEGNRPGRAVRTRDGFVVSGRWTFASGIGHATWLLAICHVHDRQNEPELDANGKPAHWLMIVPKHAATIHDVWHVSGLRGTGSQSFSLSDEFVPAGYALHVAPSARRERGPLYLFSNNGFFGPAFGSVALGLAHAALGAAIAMAGGKIPRGNERSIRESSSVQSAVGVAQARLGAARAFLHDTLADVWGAVQRDASLAVEQQVRVRLAATHATHESAAVVDAAYSLAGSNAIFETGPFARRFRDVHAVAQQFQGRRAHYETVGRYLLGLGPDSSVL